MADSLFNREPPDDDGPPRGVGDAEGVRLIDPAEAAAAVERGAAARRKGSDEPRPGDRPEPPAAPVTPSLRFPLGSTEDPAAIERPRPAAGPTRLSSVSDATGQHPVISIGPATGETELPHWTASATGEVPKAIAGDADEAGDDAWSSYAAAGPRWRDQHDAWDEQGFADLAADLADDDSVKVGALAGNAPPADGITHDEFLDFEDLDVPAAAPPTADLSRVTARGTAADPIRIGASSGRRAPSPPLRPAPAAPSGAPGGTGGRDLRAAVTYGLGMAIAAIVMFLIGPLTTMLYVLAVLVVSVGEFYAAVRKKGFTPLAPIGLAATVALPITTYAKGEAGIPIVVFLAFVVGAIWYITGVATEHPMANLGVTLFGVVYVGVLGSFASLMLVQFDNVPGHPGKQGTSVLLLAVLAAVAYDVGGLFGGSRFGRRPLSKHSPNKTLEGLLCGCAAALVVVFLLGNIFGPLRGGDLLLVALAGAVIAPIGDLTESLLKRDLGIKDFSDLIPGHGGVLDRFDGLLLVLPAVYYTTRAVLHLI